MANFTCPACGHDEFAAWYYTAETQACTLERSDDGEFEASYTGEMIGDSEAGPDETYVCRNCDWTVTVGKWEYTSQEPQLEWVPAMDNVDDATKGGDDHA